jgi:hypothetical protein
MGRIQIGFARPLRNALWSVSEEALEDNLEKRARGGAIFFI